MLLVTFAVHHESRFFRRTPAAAGVRIVHTGIGATAAARILHDELAMNRPEAVISSGFAGGLDPSLEVGDLIAGESVSSPELLRLVRSNVFRGRIHTVESPIELTEAKARLYRETAAHAVDMETEAVVGECGRAGVPVLVIRAISDGAEDEIPVPLEIAWDLKKQRARPMQLCGYLAMRPGKIGAFWRFLGSTNTASRALAHEVSNLLTLRADHIINE